MIHNWKNLQYLIKHKYWVFRCGLITGAPLWRLIIHDWSKFTPLEWTAYANYFYREGGTYKHKSSGGQHDPGKASDRFNRAWLSHQHRNPHHWQHWVLQMDSGPTVALKMPAHFVREMVADWMGAGVAQGNPNDIWDWYERNKEKMILHPQTRDLVENIIDSLPRKYV